MSLVRALVLCVVFVPVAHSIQHLSGCYQIGPTTAPATGGSATETSTMTFSSRSLKTTLEMPLTPAGSSTSYTCNCECNSQISFPSDGQITVFAGTCTKSGTAPQCTCQLSGGTLSYTYSGSKLVISQNGKSSSLNQGCSGHSPSPGLAATTHCESGKYGGVSLGVTICCQTADSASKCAGSSGTDIECSGCTINGNAICSYDVTGGGHIVSKDYTCDKGDCSNSAVDIVNPGTLINIQTCEGSTSSTLKMIMSIVGCIVCCLGCSACCWWRYRVRQQQQNNNVTVVNQPSNQYHQYPQPQQQPLCNQPEYQTAPAVYKPPPPAGNSRLPPGWREEKEDGTGDTYYVSPSGITQWERPN